MLHYSRENKIAEFPDAITSRGTKHLIKPLVDSMKKKAMNPYVLFLTTNSGYRVLQNI